MSSIADLTTFADAHPDVAEWHIASDADGPYLASAVLADGRTIDEDTPDEFSKLQRIWSESSATPLIPATGSFTITSLPGRGPVAARRPD